MDSTDGRLSGEPLKGGAELRELALSALAALERADLADAAQALNERMLSRIAESLLERSEENDMARWRFKPMAELVLLEAIDLARATDLPADERRRRIARALDMAGF